MSKHNEEKHGKKADKTKHGKREDDRDSKKKGKKGKHADIEDSKKKDGKSKHGKKGAGAKKATGVKALHCPHCKNHCPLTSPRCKKGRAEAKRLGV